MREFAYRRARDAAEAVRLGAAPGTRFLGGGTNLVDLMKLGVERPDRLVDVTGLPYDAIEERGGGLSVGAGVRNGDLAAHPLLRLRYPAVSQALLSGASGQLRNAATVGGNLLQRTRCGYFQDVTKPCNKREPGSGCPAREGEHRNLAILGASPHCVATHPSDLAVALVAMDAVVRVQEAGGAREVPLERLYVPPGEHPERETVLGPGALVTAVDLPPLPMAAGSRYRKVRERASYAFAIVSVAAALEVRDGVVHDVRLAFGAVAPRPWRARRAEEGLRGGPASPRAYRDAIARELAAAEPLRDNGYKVPLVTTVAVRLLTELTPGEGTPS